MDSNVTFEYKDYTDGGKKKKMSLPGAEFLRRYEQHILHGAFARSGTMATWAITKERSG